MLVQGGVQHRVLIVHLEQVTMTFLDLVDGLLGPELGEMVTIRVEHLLNEVAVAQLDDLIRHHRRGILFERLIVFVAFSADVAEPGDDEHGVLSKLAHDLLLGWRVQALVARLGERALVLDVKDELGSFDAPLLCSNISNSSPLSAWMMPNIAIRVPMSVWMSDSCCAINNERFCDMTNVLLISLMAGVMA